MVKFIPLVTQIGSDNFHSDNQPDHADSVVHFSRQTMSFKFRCPKASWRTLLNRDREWVDALNPYLSSGNLDHWEEKAETKGNVPEGPSNCNLIRF